MATLDRFLGVHRMFRLSTVRLRKGDKNAVDAVMTVELKTSPTFRSSYRKRSQDNFTRKVKDDPSGFPAAGMYALVAIVKHDFYTT